jgi:4-amino-4-deoxy-L-arabinose transferase-like glycosyltransferase
MKFLRTINPGKFFVFAFLCLWFLPRVVKKGMFGDGLLYASMARNMAVGRGTFWSPFFSSSYWLENIPETYFENPPLMLWLESFLFYILGDQWWIEKLFSLLVVVLNIFLFRFLWGSIFMNDHHIIRYWYITLFWWYCIPVVVWGNVNNLMDNLLLSFCLGALSFFIRGIQKMEFSYSDFMIGIVFVFGGILTKGPVALYPLALPFMYWLVWRRPSFSRTFYISLLIAFLTSLLFILLLITIPEAKYFFSEYWDQRLKAVIVGSRNDMALSGWNRLYILQQLFIELTPSIVLAVILYIFARIRKIEIFGVDIDKNVWLFILVGFSATLPILLSTKQSGIYLLPGIPMFSIAFAILTLPIVRSLFETPYFQTKSLFFNSLFLVVLIYTMAMTFQNFGKARREAALIKDIEIIKTFIPASSKIGVCEELMENFVIHTYMQRMGKYELCKATTLPLYIVYESQCKVPLSENMKQQYRVINNKGLGYFTLYQKIE